MFYLMILLCFVFFAGLAMSINEGIWSNTISLLSIMIAGLFALVGGVPLGNWSLEQFEKDQSFAWYFVFAGIWGVFALSIAVICLATERASRTRMRFVPLVEKIGGPLMGLFVAVMFTSFAAYSLERIPIKAGEWKLAEASETQKTFFKYARAPFLNVANNFAKSEELDTKFIAH